jgi:hypothetical protein
VEGTAISLVIYRIKGNMGIAEAQVDDGPVVKIDAWFRADWGGYMAFQLIARDLKSGKHQLRIKLLEERNAASQGSMFQIHAILKAGLK